MYVPCACLESVSRCHGDGRNIALILYKSSIPPNF